MEKSSKTVSLSFDDYKDMAEPLKIPANFDSNAPVVDQVIYTLGYMMEGTVEDIANKLIEFNPSLSIDDAKQYSNDVLVKLHELAKVNTMHVKGQLKYHLHKEVVSHRGQIDPDELELER
ncbi:MULTISPECIES: hypothetical protein [Olivibacter]|jgi:hypothetical protein|uniref:Uncharacterized protein n=3 Tax=Sphingobacteriaceae TaxID=84566 RepID=F4C7L8_SPHS2|nr:MULTISPECIES: hypothetical protein [Olivibacter]MCL4641844.1 hypothetical protein [Olivibacter sp. UJ_SKK_5.1]MDM8173371.1 hypothetical protein [Olivibacter sp. 47]MDX3915193.1 hypothetical protein [Pseudosphingobacterium sp.]QEL03145.1 hypothetical protein FKG96_20715 [Olivibacter sp. LS-1]